MVSMKTALITGITGQDGSYLAELLLEKGYEVHGIIRRSSSPLANLWRIEHLVEKNLVTLHYGDMSDASSLHRIIALVAPDEIYNLAAQSHVRDSFDVPEYTAQTDALGPLRILEAVRQLGDKKRVRVYQGSTSEMFGDAPAPQNEQTRFSPRSPYGAAKIYAYHITRNYRDAYNIHASNGILFNHESERRGDHFVTRMITRHAAQISLGLDTPIPMSNYNSKRDWGHAKDYVEAMWRVLQQDTPDDYVIATGEQHSNREFCEKVFGLLNIPVTWQGAGADETCIRTDTGAVVAFIDPKLYRPTDVTNLCGDPTKAKTKLGWEPKISFDELVREMTFADLERAKRIIK
jgi:GDPmannose 4,6-dehydratase